MFHQLPPYAGTSALPSAPTVAPSLAPLTTSNVVVTGGLANVATVPTHTQQIPMSLPTPPPPHPNPAQPPPPHPLDLSRVPPDQHPAAFEYDDFLAQLTFNSKDLINMLSRVAHENLHNSDAIVAVLHQRILTAPPTAKLPLLYLVDSIVKNVGDPYIQAFGLNLFHMFTTAYADTTPQVRMSMHRLLNTWPPIFGLEVVTAMRRRAADIDAASRPMQPVPVQSATPAYPAAALRMPQGLRIPQGLQMPPRQQQPPQINPPQMPAYPPQMTKPSVMPPTVAGQPPQQVMGMVGPQSEGLPMNKGAIPPGLRSASVAAPVPAPNAQFIQVQTMMNDISRKASMGVAPSNHQLFTINRLITTQLSASSSPVERETLLRFQQQLREIPARVARAPSRATSNPFPVSFSQPNTLPVPSSQALSSLLSNLPPGLLAPQKQPNIMQSTVPIPTPPNMASVSATPAHIPPVPRRPSVSVPSLPNVLKFSDLKNISHAAAVRSLYTDLPHLSKSDGMRFATKEQLREHLDWLFKKNRSKRARERGLAVGGSSRCWFEPLKDILGVEKWSNNGEEDHASGTTAPTVNESDGGAGKEKGEGTAIIAQGASEMCQACHEELESFWSDDQQAWMLKDAIRTDDNEVYHRTCIETSGTPRLAPEAPERAVLESKVEDAAPSPAKGEPHAAPKIEDVSMKAEQDAMAKPEDTDAERETLVTKPEAVPIKPEPKVDVVPVVSPELAVPVKEEAVATSKKRPREEGAEASAPETEETKAEVGDGESPMKRAKVEGNV